MSQTPNILYVFTDQQTASAMSCAGNPHLATPAMDSLADGGVRLPNAYCAYPLCTPSRAAMLTGRLPHEVGVNDLNDSVDEGVRPRSLGRLLEAAGYDCGYGGKWHLPGREVPGGWGFEQICGHDDTQLDMAACDFLRQDREKPFFLMVSFDDPHNICDWSRGQNLPWGNLPEAGPGEYPPLPLNHAVAPEAPEALIEEYEQANPLLFCTTRYGNAEWKRYLWAYYRMVERVDARLGRILSCLDEQGLTRDTLVVFTSDHGDGAAAHRWNQKMALYEESVRVPLLIRAPGARFGVTDPTVVSTAGDLFATICDYAGVDVPGGNRGDSIRPQLEGGAPLDRPEGVYAETAFGPALFKGRGNHTFGRMVRTDRYKYVVYSWGLHREQLHDIAADRGEMQNLAGCGRYRDVLHHHRRLMREWIEKTDDHRATRAQRRSIVPED